MGLFGFGNNKKISEYMENGDTAFRKEDYSTATEWYQKALDLGYSDAYGKLGYVYMVLGDEEKMMSMFKKGISSPKPSASAYRGMAECYTFGIGMEQDLYKVRKHLNESENAFKYLVDDFQVGDARRKLNTAKREFDEEMKEYKEWQKEKERIKELTDPKSMVLKAVRDVPKELIKGLHPYRISRGCVWSLYYDTTMHFKIAPQDVAVTLNISFFENKTFSHGFKFTSYGVASSYFLSFTAALSDSNFTEHCAVTLPFKNLISVEVKDKLVVCRYSDDTPEIRAYAGDHVYWLCECLKNIIKSGLPRFASPSPFLEVEGHKH